MRPLAEFDARGIHGVLTDLDDTLSTDGRLDPEAFAAMNRLREAGLRVVPVTGRSAGWCDHFVRMWPVDAVIGETGAFYMLREGGGVRTVFMPDAAALEAARTRRGPIAEAVLREVPEAALAGDQPYRLVDLAIDIAEAVPPVAPERVARIVALLRAHGMHAQPSSIHVNAWFGEFDKGRTALELLAGHFGETDEAARDRWVCVGDAPNDAPLFAAFRNSVGVANLLERADRMPVLPRWITGAPSGAGFAELAAHLLAAR
ncbi:HAD-IIB family hydrolase [Zeimonas arvi]|uniref:HAD-IIB family hydrolase n=1 Tax=Zeimonas arvi TaxID=2498847 RepID=A0A5C8P6A1_9BURK|nr:HAD-IIB family hydrolase [Zeimonas arvi]TXL68574.1 HAD-IIB family hydrolase [Zeimonas arvi]